MNLKNKKVLITGATGGIGHSLVKKFKNNGSLIFGTGTNEEKLDKLKNEFNIYTEKFSLDHHSNIEQFIDTVFKKLDGLDVVINNAGITLDNLSIRLSEENWKKVVDINLTSTFLMCKYSIKKMLKKKYGRILNCSSIGVKFGGGQKSFNYSFSKHCLEFIPNSYKAWSKKNVLINNLRIGLTNTKIHKKNSKNKFLSKRINLVPMQRMASTKEIADFIIKVIDEKNSFMTGQTLSISGGE